MNISEVELEYRNTPDESWKRVNFIKTEVLDKIKAEVINFTGSATPERI